MQALPTAPEICQESGAAHRSKRFRQQPAQVRGEEGRDQQQTTRIARDTGETEPLIHP